VPNISRSAISVPNYFDEIRLKDGRTQQLLADGLIGQQRHFLIGLRILMRRRGAEQKRLVGTTGRSATV